MASKTVLETLTAREILSDDEILARRDRNAFDGGFEAGSIYGIDIRTELLEALKELVDISGEANIPLTSTKAVRLMAKFVQAREAAQTVIAKAEATSGN